MAMFRSRAGESGGEPGDERYAPMAEINVTPMVDVMLVLLVIFMVTAPLLSGRRAARPAQDQGRGDRRIRKSR